MRRFGIPLFVLTLGGCESGLDALVAGAPDGGASRIDSGPPPAPGCPAGAFCDDFEGNDLATKWSAIENDGARGIVGIVDVEAHGAARSLHVATPMAPSGASLQHLLGGARSSGLIAVRAWFAITPGAPVPRSASLVEVRRSGRQVGGVSLKLFAGKLGYDVTGLDGQSRAPGAAMVAGFDGPGYRCLRFYVDVGTPGRLRILGEGETPLVDVTLDTLVGSQGWEAVSIGLPFVLDTPGADLHLDDVVIADQPIGCQ